MMGSLLLLAALVAGGPVEAQRRPLPISATPTSVSVTPEARNLFEQDWVLMNWALKYYDADHDVLLEPAEAAAAAARFRQIADSNHDGRVTPEEYRIARELILSQ